MRIGLLAPDLSTDNGWATYSLNLIRQLRARGIATTVVCASNSPAVEFEVRIPCSPPLRRRNATPSSSRWRLIPRVSRLLRDCDIVHCTD